MHEERTCVWLSVADQPNSREENCLLELHRRKVYKGDNTFPEYAVVSANVIQYSSS